jgi:thioredoxin 1
MGKVEVIELNDMNVGDVAKRLHGKKPVFVAYLADWCGHCRDFKPHWEMVKQDLRMQPENMNGMVITANDQIMRQLPLKQPSGFPTMSLYNGTEFVDDYKGMRSKDDVLAFIKSHLKEKKMRKAKKSRKSRRLRMKKKKGKKSRKIRKTKNARKMAKRRKRTRKLRKRRKR